jgi:hypothetical protein
MSDRPLSKTEQLVADVIAAGGTLSLPDDTYRGGVNWRQRAYAAQRHGKVPGGKHLTVSWNDQGFVINLVEGSTGTELGADPVPVPARVGRYHGAAQQFRDRTAVHEVSPQRCRAQLASSTRSQPNSSVAVTSSTCRELCRRPWRDLLIARTCRLPAERSVAV